MKNLSIAHTLSNKCTKNLCKRTVLLQLIIKNVVTFFWNTVYVAASAGVTVLPAFKRILNNTPLLTNRKNAATATTCSTVSLSFLLLQLLHKTTTSDLDCTIYSYRNIPPI